MGVLSFISTMTVFGTAVDVTLSELSLALSSVRTASHALGRRFGEQRRFLFPQFGRQRFATILSWPLVPRRKPGNDAGGMAAARENYSRHRKRPNWPGLNS
jgi:hypothetical protein